jgi:hypothetical protein
MIYNLYFIYIIIYTIYGIYRGIVCIIRIRVYNAIQVIYDDDTHFKQSLIIRRTL